MSETTNREWDGEEIINQFDDNLPLTTEEENDNKCVSVAFTEEEYNKVKKDAEELEIPTDLYVTLCAIGDKRFVILKRIVTMNRMLRNLYATMKDTDIPDDYRTRMLSKIIDMGDTIEDIKSYLDTENKEETSNE